MKYKLLRDVVYIRCDMNYLSTDLSQKLTRNNLLVTKQKKNGFQKKNKTIFTFPSATYDAKASNKMKVLQCKIKPSGLLCDFLALYELRLFKILTIFYLYWFRHPHSFVLRTRTFHIYTRSLE